MDEPARKISIKRATNTVFLRSLEAELNDLLDSMLDVPEEQIPVENKERLKWIEYHIQRVQKELSV